MKYKKQIDNKSCGAIAIQNMECLLGIDCSNISLLRKALKINKNEGVLERDYLKFLRKRYSVKERRTVELRDLSSHSAVIFDFNNERNNHYATMVRITDRYIFLANMCSLKKFRGNIRYADLKNVIKIKIKDLSNEILEKKVFVKILLINKKEW